MKTNNNYRCDCCETTISCGITCKLEAGYYGYKLHRFCDIDCFAAYVRPMPIDIREFKVVDEFDE